MARAYNIFVVIDTDECNNPIAAFTVKREMESWLERKGHPAYYAVVTIRDGGR